MRVGPHGILQPLADVLKLFLKEDITRPAPTSTCSPRPDHRSRAVAHRLRRDSLRCRALAVRHRNPRRIADVNVGLLYIISVAGIASTASSWAAGPRTASTRCSPACARRPAHQLRDRGDDDAGHVIMLSGTLSMWHRGRPAVQGWWFAFMQPVAFASTSSAAWRRRTRAVRPARGRTGAGGGVPHRVLGHALRVLLPGEYANMIVVSSVATTLFLGGWLAPFPNVPWLSFLGLVPAGRGSC